jgi:hypothetical protein
LSGQDAAIVSSASPGAAQIFTIRAPRTPACADRFATTPAIRDPGRMRDNAPHITEG